MITSFDSCSLSGVHEDRLSEGTITEIEDPYGGTQSFQVAPDGQVVGEIDALDQVYPGDTDGPRPWTRRFWRSGEGDLLAREDSLRGTSRYAHDAAHRMVGVQHPDGREDEYGYDAAGNLLRKPGLLEGYVGATAPGHNFTTGDVALTRGNKLYRANGDRFFYNERDHISAREGTWGRLGYEYDALDRLRRITFAAALSEHAASHPPAVPPAIGQATTYAEPAPVWEADYDALGRRVETRTLHVPNNGANANEFHRQRYWWYRDRLAAEESADGTFRVYVYVDDEALVPLMRVDYASRSAAKETPESGKRFYFFTDHRGCPERVEDDDGVVVWEATIHPFGECVVHVGHDFHQPLRFPGHYYDEFTKLHYNRFRYYSPELGRYLQSDPMGIAGGLNLYGYCADTNPLRDVDLRGLSKTCPPKEEAEGASEDGVDAEQARLAAEDAALRLDEPGSPNQSVEARIASGEANLSEGSRYARNPHRYYFADGNYHLRPSERAAGSARSQHYPSGFTPETHGTMARRHTREGQAHQAAHEADPRNVPAPPPVRGADADGIAGLGEPLERHEMSWMDERGKDISYYMQDVDDNGIPIVDADGQPQLARDRNGNLVTNLTYGHEPPLVQRFTEPGGGHTQSCVNRGHVDTKIAGMWTPRSPACGRRDRACGHQDRGRGHPDREHVDTEQMT